MKIKSSLNLIKKKLTIEKQRTQLQFFCVFVIFAVVSLMMTIVNIFTGYQPLMIATSIFCLLNVGNVVLSLFKKEFSAKILFSIELIALFTFFILSGIPNGFSAIWIVLLPMAGMLLYRRKYGSVICGVQFMILIFFFWIPLGKNLLLFEYTPDFMLRFPLLYLASFLVGFFFESVRAFTQEELVKARDRYRNLSFTDSLTGLGNETYYFSMLNKLERSIEKGTPSFAIAMMDVNCVKQTNDTYGHRFGCHLIVTAGKILPSIFTSSKIFHVGGDEFIVLVTGDDYKNLDHCVEQFKEKLGYTKINYEKVDLILSVAIGTAVYQKGEQFNDTIQRADKDMYRDKAELKAKYHLQER